MPDLNTRTRVAPAGPEALSPVREKRIDPPHRMANGRTADSSANTIAQLEGTTDVEVEAATLAVVQQLRTQAQQLSEHLALRQADIDRREAELQARAALLDQEERNNRLWLKDRHDELAEQEAGLKARQNELQLRADRLQESEQESTVCRRDAAAELQARRDNLDRRETAIRETQEQLRAQSLEIASARLALENAGEAHAELIRDLERRLQEFNARRTITVEMISRFLAGQPILPARPKHVARSEAAEYLASRQRLLQPDLDQAPTHEARALPDEFDEIAGLLCDLQSRRARIEEMETLLARTECEVAKLRQSLLADRKQLEAERQQNRRRDDETRRKNEADFARRRESLETASQQLELRRAAVEQMRSELVGVQRDALENRLAAEELMTQLAGTVPSAKLSQRLAQLRNQLANCYRLQQDHLAQERAQLESLARQLTMQHDRMATQKRDLEVWLRERSGEFDAAVGQLAQRESQLDRQREQIEQQRFEWEHERQQYQHEIRRLLAELGS